MDIPSTLRKVSSIISMANLGNDVWNWLSRDQREKQTNLLQVTEQVAFLFGEEILADILEMPQEPMTLYTERSQHAADRIRRATIHDPSLLVRQMEQSYRDLWVISTGSRWIDEKYMRDDDPRQTAFQELAVGVLAILAELYRRPNIASCALDAQNTGILNHGWQINNANKYQTKDHCLSEERNWYGYHDALALFQKLLVESAIETQRSITKDGEDLFVTGNPIAILRINRFRNTVLTGAKCGMVNQIAGKLHMRVLARIIAYAKDACPRMRTLTWRDLSFSPRFAAELQKTNAFADFSATCIK